MNISIISTMEEFKTLKNEWDSLLEQSSGTSIFLSWEWLFTWWEMFGAYSGRSLFIIVAREGGQLVGIAPFIKRQLKIFGSINRTRLEFLGTGEDEKDEVCSNYMDFIVATGSETAFVNEAANLLASKKNSFDELFLSSVPESSAAINYFVKLLRGRLHNFNHKIIKTSSCLFINLPLDWEAYLSAIGNKTRRNIRRDRKLLADKGPLEYATYSDAEAYKYFDVVIDLHKKRWQVDMDKDMFSSKMFLGFHEKLSRLFAEKGWLKIGILTNNGQRIAASYHFVYKNNLFAYQVGCHDNYDKRLSVGMAEFGFSIEGAIKEKCKEYDFFKASLKGYKALLAKNIRNVIDIRIARYDFIEKVIGAAKKIKSSIARNGPKQK